MTAFSDWFESLAAERGMTTMAEVARRVDIPQSNITRWRTLGAVPDMKSLRKVSDGLNVPIQELLVRAGYVRPDEVGVIHVRTETKVETLTNEELLAELARRLGKG